MGSRGSGESWSWGIATVFGIGIALLIADLMFGAHIDGSVADGYAQLTQLGSQHARSDQALRSVAHSVTSA